MTSIRRGLAVVGFALLAVAQGTGAAIPIAAAECIETCPSDDPDGHCPSDCLGCSCHAPRRVEVRPVELMLPAFVVAARVTMDEALPPSPEPQRIRHVPKAA